ncbi:hypothetical protein MRY17_18330 [Pseudomonas orientalis]|uniref:hypothetical protein n=1 Tax=Pseudomonas orientalis TaxID=76758 RepID=UPI001FAECD27|nr:hypothetical protein [Pseudomonas orientalis]UOB22672.1 hypothetical protein MRY17_18330 [Pseudomonas orientalis]
MAILDFMFSVKLFELTSSISIMTMLAEQAEKNVQLAVDAADESDAVKEGHFEEEAYDENGESYSRTRTYYSCGSCVGYDDDEVKLEYKSLIADLTRRSAYLTMFGLFEHRISGCLDLMIGLANFSGELKCKGPIEKAHAILKKGFDAKDINDIDHLTMIRNIMTHNDGIATDYHKIFCKKEKKTEFEKRLVKAIGRTEGVEVNPFNNIIVDERFLRYAVAEFNRYATGLEQTIQSLHRQSPSHQLPSL